MNMEDSFHVLKMKWIYFYIPFRNLPIFFSPFLLFFPVMTFQIHSNAQNSLLKNFCLSIHIVHMIISFCLKHTRTPTPSQDFHGYVLNIRHNSIKGQVFTSFLTHKFLRLTEGPSKITIWHQSGHTGL